MAEKFSLSYVDYGVFSFLLVVSACIGLYFSIFGGKQKTNNDYLLAGKNMSIFPISFSLMTSFISVATLMGLPTEMYLFGTNMTFINLGFILGPLIASYFFLPIYFNTGVSTPFEYLEKRFGKTTRRILSVIFLLQHVLYSGVSLYAPALALSAVTDLSMWISIISIAAVGIFYSTLGGMRAVIWTDMFQAVLMYTCLICIIVKGCFDLDGIQNIFKRANEGERIILPMFKMDFSVRYTMWSILIQGMIISASSFVGDQAQVQRQLTLETLKRSIICSLLSIPMIITFQLLCCMCGIIIYVYFQTCDPVTSSYHQIESYDQLLPYYIISAMNEYPGLPGLCIAGIFSVSLSTISSSMNAMAAVTYQDIIRTLWTDLKKEVFITKTANFFYGVLSIFVTLLVASMGNIVKACILVLGIVAGPALGVFFLASFTTTANEMGVNIGVLAGFLLAGFLSFLPNERNYPILPIENDCSGAVIRIANASVAKYDINSYRYTSNTSLVHSTSTPVLPDNFPVSFMWISPLSLLVCLIIGYAASWIISYIRGTSKAVPPEFLNPFRQRFCGENNRIQNRNPKTDATTYNTCM